MADTDSLVTPLISSLSLVDVAFESAERWVLWSLHEGGRFSSAVLANVALRPGRIQALVPAGVEQERLSAFERGRLTSTVHADRALEEVLAGYAKDGGRCVLVEDDLGRRDDPRVVELPFPKCFVGDRVSRWTELPSQNGAHAARELIRTGASGYPLNAFVSWRDASALGLDDGAEAPPTAFRSLARALVAVVVAAYDAEGELLLAQSP